MIYAIVLSVILVIVLIWTRRRNKRTDEKIEEARSRMTDEERRRIFGKLK